MRLSLLHIICVIALFSSCNWVNDDLSKCPTGTWLKIAYTYNILDVDAVSTQVGDISIYAFDKNDKYVGRVDVDSVTLHQDYCMVKLPFSEGSYNLIVWGGATEQKYNCPTLSSGITERSDLSLTLSCGSGNQHREKLNSLFYSSLENVTIGNEYRVVTASLMKNTNHFSCLLQDVDNGVVNQKDFTFVLEANNGVMNYANLPIDTEPVFYHPYHQHTTILTRQIPAVNAKLTTLRLMKDDQTTFTIKHIPSGQNILQIPITQYLILTKAHNLGFELDDQEYLDRQDSYALLFFIKSVGTNVPQICSKMSVNGWMIRINSPELED